MKFNLTLVHPKKDSSGIKFITYIDGNRFVAGLGVTVPTDKWDKKRQRLNSGSDKSLIAVEQEIDDAIHGLKKLYNELAISPDVELTATSLREAYKRQKQGKEGLTEKALSFDQWVDEFMEQLEKGKRFGSSGKALSIGTVKRYRVVHELLTAFRVEKRAGKRVEFDDVDVKFINDWKRWRADGKKIGRKVVRPGVSVNTLSNDMKILKVWLKASYLDELHDNRIWQRKEMQKTEVVPERPRLTIEEMKKLELATFDHLRKGPQGPKSTAHETVRDMFMLACWTCARISDVKRFPEMVKVMWDDNGGKCPSHVEIIQAKTNTPARMPLVKPARKIIEKYEGRLPKLPSGPKTNLVLKEVLKAAGITRSYQKVSTSIDGGKPEMVRVCDTISFHDGRRTAATNLNALGLLTKPELMRITGHSTEAQLNVYIKEDNNRLDESIDRKLKDAFSDWPD